MSRLTAQKKVFSSNATITQKVESESKKVVGGYKDRMVKIYQKLVAEGPML